MHHKKGMSHVELGEPSARRKAIAHKTSKAAHKAMKAAHKKEKDGMHHEKEGKRGMKKMKGKSHVITGQANPNLPKKYHKQDKEAYKTYRQAVKHGIRKKISRHASKSE